MIKYNTTPWYIRQLQQACKETGHFTIIKKVVVSVVTCETTVEYCAYCEEVFNRQTDC